MTTSYDVHVMGSDGVELRCIRVPVTATSTVRQLATDCLSRFVMQSRFNTPNIDVVVDDVTSAGCSLFYNDPIAAVVRPTELLALHIRNVSSTDVVPRRIAMHTNTTGVSPADASVIKVSAATIPSAAAPIAIVSTAEIKRARDETPATEPAQPRRPQPAAPVAPAPAATAPQANNARQVKDKNLGWGEASHKTYPQNYVADPDQMIRQLRKQQKAAAEKKKLEAKQAAEQQAAEAPQEVLTSKPLGPQQINTAAASLSKLELYCDQDVQEVRRPLTAYNVARQLTYA